jgi:hypothetical protein
MMFVKKLEVKGTGSRYGLNLVYMLGLIKVSRKFAAGFFQMLKFKKNSFIFLGFTFKTHSA